MPLDKEKIREMIRLKANIRKGGPSPIFPEVSLESMTIEGVEIDFCPKSHGIWLDCGEASDIGEGLQDFPDFEWSWNQRKLSSKKSPKYPQELMWELPYDQKYDLKVDYCEKSKGIWLDASEISNLEIIMANNTDPQQRLHKLYEDMKKNGYVSLSCNS